MSPGDMIPLTVSTSSGQTHRGRKEDGGFQGMERGKGGESLFNACRVPVSQDGNHSGADGSTTV